MSDPFVGEIKMVGFNYAPRGWAFCNGQVMSIAQNTALFSLLGTTYGGNGTTTFALPDLRSRVPIHPGQGTGLSPYVQGQLGGTENVTLTQQQMPAHNHLINASKESGTAASPANASLAVASVPSTGDPVSTYNTGPLDVTLSSGTVSTIGGSQPHPNIQPYLCVYFIIALQGIFPSRN